MVENEIVLYTLRHADLENVKSFTRTNTNKPDFTLRKACKSRQTYKTELMGLLVMNKCG